MANPQTKVYIGFDLTASGGNFFALDDTTRGVLDSTYVLGGDVLVDVSEYVVGITVDRGKSRELDRFTAGQATVKFNNDTRVFDPFYSGSPYYTQILPRKQVVIESNGVRQFSGYIDDWDLEYELGVKSFATIKCIDGFLQLSATELAEFTNTSQTSGQRIVEILNRPEVAWPVGERDIDTGQQTLQADTVAESTNVLNYLQLIESSEPGSLFIAKDGSLTFRDRITTPPLVNTIVFADNLTEAESVVYNEIQVVYGSELLHNRVVVTREGGTPQISDSLTSQSIYGVQSLSLDGLLIDTDDNSLKLANYLLGKYDQPELRFSAVGFSLEEKSGTDQGELLALEINDVVKIKFTPNNVGDPIEEYGVITGIQHSIGINFHQITFEFGTVSDFPLILDHPTFGRLGGALPLYDDVSTSYDDDLVRYDGTEEFGYILAF